MNKIKIMFVQTICKLGKKTVFNAILLIKLTLLNNTLFRKFKCNKVPLHTLMELAVTYNI